MAVDSYKTAGGAMGMLVGWFIERRFIKFSTDISTPERIVRVVFCIFTYTAIDSLAGNAVDMLTAAGLGTGMAKAIMQFVCLLYFMAIAPGISKVFSNFFAKK